MNNPLTLARARELRESAHSALFASLMSRYSAEQSAHDLALRTAPDCALCHGTGKRVTAAHEYVCLRCCGSGKNLRAGERVAEIVECEVGT